jgi:hypothetical protein
MEIARSCGEFSDTDHRIINYCRLYMHVTTVSEMFDVDGTRLLLHMIRCERPTWFNTTLNVTIQRRPSCQQQSRRWKKLCNVISEHPNTSSWILPLRLHRETYQIVGGDEVYHWYRGAYWICLAPTIMDTHTQLTLLHPTEWIPTQNNAVPLSTTARIKYHLYTVSSLEP